MKHLSNVRIRYDKDGISVRTFQTPKGDIKVKINTKDMTFQLIDAMYNLVIVQGGGTSNLNLLKKKAKEKLCELMGVSFEQEARPSRRGKRVGGIKARSIDSGSD